MSNFAATLVKVYAQFMSEPSIDHALAFVHVIKDGYVEGHISRDEYDEAIRLHDEIVRVQREQRADRCAAKIVDEISEGWGPEEDEKVRVIIARHIREEFKEG